MTKKSKRNKWDDGGSPPKFKVGDRVVMRRGYREVEAVVVEDRGPLGIDGERIYGVHFEFLPGEMRYTERDEGELALLGTPMRSDRDVPVLNETRPPAKKRKNTKSGEEEQPPKFKVGDRVVFRSGNGDEQGVVVEDRGPLGIGGRRLYGLHYEFLPGETRYTEMPEADLTPAPET
jgi:co-chaperonin GroES (HSP10)